MKKPLLWILIVSMIAVFSLAGCKAEVAEEVTEEGVVEEPVEEVVEEEEDEKMLKDLDRQIIVINRNIKEKNDYKNYMIDVNYPEIEGLNDIKEQEIINNKIKNIVDVEINDFKNCEHLIKLDSEEYLELKEDNLAVEGFKEINYNTFLLSNNIISLLFTIDTYYPGAAHHMTRTLSFNYNIVNGSNIMLEDLFKSDFDYLNFVSDYCVKDLREQPIYAWEDIAENGASPDENNFKSFILKEESLIIFFDPYQVAGFSVGIIEVRIPYSKFKNNFNPEGPISLIIILS